MARDADEAPDRPFGSSFVERFTRGGGLDERLLDETLRELSNQELGLVLVAAVEASTGQHPSGPEVARLLQVTVSASRSRFQHYARKISQRYCIRLSHRNAPGACGEGCDTVAVLDGPVLDRIVASAERVSRRNGTSAHRLGHFYDWAASGFRMYAEPDGPVVGFNQHLARRSHRGWSDELLRAWNHDRGLVQRLRVGGTSAVRLEARLGEVFSDSQLLDRVAEPFAWPLRVEVVDQDGLREWTAAWLDALYTDACQAPVPGRTIDVLRVARRLDAKRQRIDRLPRSEPGRGLAYRLFLDSDASAAWSELVARVDDAIRDAVPDTYRRLEAARAVSQGSVARSIGDASGTDAHSSHRSVEPADDGDVADDAIVELSRAELEDLFDASSEATAFGAYAFAIRGLDHLVEALEEARAGLQHDETIAAALGRVLRPGQPPTDDEIQQLQQLIARAVSIIQGEELP